MNILDFILYGKGVNLIIILLAAIILYACSILYYTALLGKLQKERKLEVKELKYHSNSVLAALTKKEFKFRDMFEESYSRSEVINTFLALLELLKRQYITVVQNGLFDDIDIVRNDDVDSILTEPINNEFDGEEN